MEHLQETMVFHGLVSQLVGGFNPSEKYESVGILIPNIWKNKKCSKPPTSQQYRGFLQIFP